MSNHEQKAVLREELLKQRQRLTKNQVNVLSQQILSRCRELIPWYKIRSMHTYTPIAERNEVDTWPLLEYIWEHQPHIATIVPIMKGKSMNQIEVDPATTWRKNKVGIPEPLDGLPSARFHQFDIIIVPVLGFDKSGNRLGYGKGHYDRFLATQPHATTIGLACAFSELKIGLPIEPHDISIDNIITEDGVLKLRTKI